MNSKYSDAYIDECFYLWYQNNKRTGNHLVASLPSENNAKPSNLTLNKWIKEYGWMERADALDAEVSRKLDDEVIAKRMKMFEEHAQVGQEMVAKGREFLTNNPLQDSQAAIRAITSGIDIQRISVGQSEAGMKILKMTDAQITKELQRLTGKTPKDDEFSVDAEILDDQDVETE